MKHFYSKVFFIIWIAITASTSQASDIFSHLVIVLPNSIEYRSEEPWLRIINNQNDWNSFYNEAATSSFVDNPPQLEQQIDFENYQVITGGLGVRPTGGYSLTVESIVETSDAIHINIIDIRPGYGCPVFSALTHPSVIFVIKKSDKPLKFNLSQYSSKC